MSEKINIPEGLSFEGEGRSEMKDLRHWQEEYNRRLARMEECQKEIEAINDGPQPLDKSVAERRRELIWEREKAKIKMEAAAGAIRRKGYSVPEDGKPYTTPDSKE